MSGEYQERNFFVNKFILFIIVAMNVVGTNIFMTDYSGESDLTLNVAIIFGIVNLILLAVILLS